MEEFLPIKSFRVKNFKGIRDSGDVRFTPLTVFIGNNGSGKSSLIEALQTYQDIVVNGLDRAMNRWRGFENIHNPPINLINKNGKKHDNAKIEFIITGKLNNNIHFQNMLKAEMTIDEGEIFISHEEISMDDRLYMRRLNDNVSVGGIILDLSSIGPNFSILHQRTGITLMVYLYLKDMPADAIESTFFNKIVGEINNLQFTALNPFNMTNPSFLKVSKGTSIYLLPDGSNIAEYLMDIRKQNQNAYDGIIESLTYVLPYLKDMQPNLTTELERTVYLRMHEDTYTIPQWLLSTGTMRILCLLALFRHPTPPPVIFIEEIENGLDPRTIHFIVEEIRNLIVLGKSQVVITTHSPYLLDLLDLSQIVVVERDNGETKFSRPADDESLRAWAKKFSPGQLYTMNQLTHQEG